MKTNEKKDNVLVCAGCGKTETARVTGDDVHLCQPCYEECESANTRTDCSACPNDPRKASIAGLWEKWLKTPAGQVVAKAHTDPDHYEQAGRYIRWAFEAGWAFLVSTMTKDIEPVLVVSSTGKEPVGTVMASLQHEDGALVPKEDVPITGFYDQHGWVVGARHLLERLGIDPNHESVDTPEKAFAYINEHLVTSIRANKPVCDTAGGSPKE